MMIHYHMLKDIICMYSACTRKLECYLTYKYNILVQTYHLTPDVYHIARVIYRWLAYGYVCTPYFCAIPLLFETLFSSDQISVKLLRDLIPLKRYLWRVGESLVICNCNVRIIICMYCTYTSVNVSQFTVEILGYRLCHNRP